MTEFCNMKVSFYSSEVLMSAFSTRYYHCIYVPSLSHGIYRLVKCLIHLCSTHSHVKLSSIVARLYLEDVEGAGVARGGLHLEDVCRHTAPRRQVHVSVQNSEGLVPAGRVLSWTHTLTAEEETQGTLSGCVIMNTNVMGHRWRCSQRMKNNWGKGAEILTCH